MPTAVLSDSDAAAEPADRRSRYAAVDPVTLVAGGLILAGVLGRLAIAQRGYLAFDDFPLISMAEENGNGPAPAYLFGLFNNHLMPAGHLVTWLTDHLAGFSYRPYLTLLLVMQAVVSIAFYRLLRLMLAPGWPLLVPLAMLVFSPLTLEASSWWAVGVNMLPMQLAMILAVGAQVKYMRTRQPRHLVTLGLAVLLGLVFFEKAILAVALVFLLTVCVYTPGGPVRAVVTAVRRWWPAWAVLTGISLAFLALYLSRATSSLRRPSSADEVVTFLTQMVGHTFLPGLVGGPWAWLGAGDGAPITAPAVAARWLALMLVLGFVAYTVWLRRATAVRAWLLVVLYAAIVAGLLGATRLGSVFSGVAGAVPRYIADVVVVAAIGAGIALCGLRREEPEAAAGPPAAEPVRRPATPLVLAGLAALLLSAVVTGVRFGDAWSVKQGRDYLATARADLAEAPSGTVFMDQPVPEGVVGPLSAPYNLQSRFFAPLDDGPVFVTQAANLSVFDDAGHIRPAWVDGVAARPGPVPGCGYKVAPGPVRIPLETGVAEFWQVVRIAYLSDRDAAAAFRIGSGGPVPFDIHRGLHAAFLLVRGGGPVAELTVTGGGATVCTDEIVVGRLVPAPAG